VYRDRLWRYRELTWFLALRDIKVRYKQTVLGAAWAIIQPVMNSVVFTLFFNKLAGVGGKDPYYFVKTFCATLPWQLFENSLTNSSNSLVGSQNLITKVYFPRLSIPISSILSGLLDFGIGLVLLALILVGYRAAGHPDITPGWPLLAMPVFVLMALLLSLGAGLWLSAMNVQYRDVRYAIPFLLRLWFFATPVAYPIDTVGSKLSPTLQFLYGLNPMVGVVEGFRWSTLGAAGAKDAPGTMVVASAVATVVLLISGMYYFRRMEKTFADVV
jgi:lipopolysaccharide transport system permease protein